jgi:hypothetical protein
MGGLKEVVTKALWKRVGGGQNYVTSFLDYTPEKKLRNPRYCISLVWTMIDMAKSWFAFQIRWSVLVAVQHWITLSLISSNKSL